MAKNCMYRSTGDGFAKQIGSAVVQERSRLVETEHSKGGKTALYFPFNNTKIGAQPLVLLGTYTEIMGWLLENWMLGIYNDLHVENGYPGTMDGIYMSVQMYRPGKQFQGLFQLHDAVTAIIKGVVDIAGGSIAGTYAIDTPVSLNDIGGIEAGLVDVMKKNEEGWTESPVYYAKNQEEAKGGTLYIRFSYCPCAYSDLVARKTLSMRAVHAILKRKLG